jgi:hypothetical protein
MIAYIFNLSNLAPGRARMIVRWHAWSAEAQKMAGKASRRCVTVEAAMQGDAPDFSSFPLLQQP